jgi:hypothetical protein
MCGRHEWLTAEDGPRFSDAATDRVRVLFESADGGERWAAGVVLAEAGYEVVTCGGPEAAPLTRCPVLDGDSCPAVCDADVVVSSIGMRWSAGLEVVAAIRSQHPDKPLIVEAPPAYAKMYHDLLDGCDVIHSLTTESLLDAVERATEPDAEGRCR